MGLALGWWLMGTLSNSGSEPPSLVQKIPSLPTVAELEPLAKGPFTLVDSIEAPAGSVWLLLQPTPGNSSGQPLVCGFARRSPGGVEPPRCRPVAAALRAHTQVARFGFGGDQPVVLLPKNGAVTAWNAWTGESHEVERGPAGLRPKVHAGTRLVRSFEVADGRTALLRTTAREGSYVGPLAGYAPTRPPEAPSHAPEASWSCATPAGYVLATLLAPERAAPRALSRLEFSFVSRGDVLATNAGHVPVTRVFDAPLACEATRGLFTWLDASGALKRLSCSPERCQTTSAKLTDVPVDSVVAVGQIEKLTAVVWRDKQQRPLVRLGALASFSTSPTAPIWKQTAQDPDWQLLGSVNTGRSLLLVFQLDDPIVVQIGADGTLENLGPSGSIDARP